MKVTEVDLQVAAGALIGLFRYLPIESRGVMLGLLQEQLYAFVGEHQDGAERLQWLVGTALVYIRESTSLAELRALYATRYKPADGIEGIACSVPNFTPADFEQKAFERHQKLTAFERARDPRLLEEHRDKMPDAEIAEFQGELLGNLAKEKTMCKSMVLEELQKTPEERAKQRQVEAEIEENKEKHKLTDKEKERRMLAIEMGLMLGRELTDAEKGIKPENPTGISLVPREDKSA